MSKRNKKYINIIIVVISIFLIIIVVLGIFFYSEKVKIARNGVVRVLVKLDEDNTYRLASGFAIDKKIILTNYHVVENCKEILVISGNEKPIKAELKEPGEYKDKDPDIAVLCIEKHPENLKILKFSGKAIDVNDDIWALGFPNVYDNDNIMLSDYTSNPKDVHEQNGKVNKIDTYKNLEIIVHSGTTSSGFSGGPLINKDGLVVGINHSGKTDELDKVVYNQAIDKDAILDFLKKNNVKYYIGNSIEVIFILILVFVIISICIGLFLVIKVNSKNKEMYVYDTNEKVDINKPKSKIKKVVKEGPISTTIHINRSTVILFGITGFFQDDYMELNNNEINIGRNPEKCQIIFPERYGDISGLHCIVKHNKSESKVYVTDYSTNGTYLKNGERLSKEKPIELQIGDFFYLSDEDKMFQIRFLN